MGWREEPGPSACRSPWPGSGVLRTLSSPSSLMQPGPQGLSLLLISSLRCCHLVCPRSPWASLWGEAHRCWSWGLLCRSPLHIVHWLITSHPLLEGQQPEPAGLLAALCPAHRTCWTEYVPESLTNMKGPVGAAVSAPHLTCPPHLACPPHLTCPPHLVCPPT